MEITFQAQQISTPTILKKHFLLNKFQEQNVKFVKLQQEDVPAMKTAAKAWGSAMASSIAFDAALFYKDPLCLSPDVIDFYAIVKNDSEVSNLKSDDILSMANVSYYKNDKDRIINFLTVKPNFRYSNAKRKLKEIGKTTLKEIEKLYPLNNIKLTSLTHVIPFYEKCGYKEDGNTRQHTMTLKR